MELGKISSLKFYYQISGSYEDKSFIISSQEFQVFDFAAVKSSLINLVQSDSYLKWLRAR